MSMDPSSAFGQVTGGPVQTSGPVAGSVQGITLPNGWNIPAFSAADFAPQYFPITYGDQAFGVDHSTQGRQLGRWNFVGDPSRYGIPNLGNQTNWDFGGDESGVQWIQVKTGDKEGTRIPVRLVDGQYVPQMEGISTVGWDTNDRAQNLALAAIAGGALAGASGLYGGGAASGGPLEPWLSPLADGGLSMGAGGLGAGGTAAGASAGVAAAGGAEAIPVPPPSPAITSPLPPLGGAGAATGGLGSLISQAGRGIGAVSNLLSGGGGGQPGGVERNATGLAGLLSALYGQKAQGAYANRLSDIASQMQERADPYMQLLRQSYEDPNAYLQSPEMQALMNLEANRLAGIDASQGRLSTDIGRTAKLQQLAQSRLGDYRRGLQQSISTIYQPQAIANLFRESAQAESGRYGDLAGWMGGGGSPGDVWGDIKDIIDVGGDIWDVISDWWD